MVFLLVCLLVNLAHLALGCSTSLQDDNQAYGFGNKQCGVERQLFYLLLLQPSLSDFISSSLDFFISEMGG